MITTFPLNEAYKRESFLPFLPSFLDDFSQCIEELYLDGKSNFANKVYRLGRDNSLDLEVYEIHHTSTNDARVGVAKDAFKVLHTQSFSNRALVVFIPEGSKQWRLSLIQIDADINDKGRVEKEYSNPRRHSYLLGEGALIKTPEKYLFTLDKIRTRKDGTKTLSPWEDLQSRFSVEALTKEFYDQLYNWYLWAVEPSTGVTFPNLVSTSQDDRDDIAIKIIRLITRLLFVWFIKQKGLVPTSLFDEDELDKILANFDPQAENDGTYYNAILQNLFFATLNNEVNKRRFMTKSFQGVSNSYGVKTLFRDSDKKSWFAISHDEVLQFFHKVPFMNCGLFECLDKYAKSDIGQEDDMFLDGFSSRDSKQNGNLKYRAFLPNKLFFAPEHSETVTVEEDGEIKHPEITVMGILPLLKLYNFTVQENTPSDMEVSLDPELLGQVFENLLAAYNPETKESARESTGSFYTPRPIVEYMVNESLIEYLKTKVPSVVEDNWRALISYSDVPFTLTDDERIATLNALYECKILDPACGSGAFPMGMLQQMVHITRKLDSEFDPYKTKLRIINNCIYGSDIQPIAMLISKLRFFISLICEQDDKSVNFDDAENNFGINTLPNLETKFVAANSLLTADVRKYADDNWTLDSDLIKLKNELLKIRQEHFSVRTQSSKLKKREEDRIKRQEIYDYILKTTTQADQIKIQMYESRIRHLNAERDLYEGEKIVEEYVSTQAELFAETEMQLVRKDINKINRDRIDAEVAELRRAIAKEKNKSNPQGFEKAIQQIADWNPYDQLNFAPFFDPEWMFGIKDCFDIVIGNPPYVNVKRGIDSLLKEKYIELYDAAEGQFDLFTLFIELALSIGNIVTYIVPKPILNNENYDISREKLLKNNLSLIVTGSGIFKTADVESCIFLTSNDCKDDIHICEYKNEMFIPKGNIKSDYCLNANKCIISTEMNSFDFKIISKLNNLPRLENFISIKRGIEAGKKDDSIVEYKTKYKLLRGEDVERYLIKYTEKYCKFDLNNTSKFKEFNLYNGEKIVIRRVSNTIQATYDDANYVVLNTIYCLKLKTNKSGNCKYYTALLNSKTIAYWFFKTFCNTDKIFPYIRISQLEQIPIPYYDELVQLKITAIVDSILATKQQNPQADTSELETQIDILVYLLYKLTYDEVKIIDPQIETIISESEYNKRLANG